MYNMTKLSAKSQAFLAELSTSSKGRSLPASIALARLMAVRLVLPTTQVECIHNFYNTQCAITVLGQLSQLNELVLLDIDTIADLTRNFYAYRYQQVYGQEHILLSSKRGVLDLFKISKYFDQATLECVDENASMITELTTRFIDITRELNHVA